MRKDYLIAIVLVLSAIPTGIALMAVPYYAEAAVKAYAAQFFWGGLFVAAFLLLGAIVIAARGESSESSRGHRRRMIALGGMMVCGVGFLGFSAAYFWPAGSNDAASASATPTSPETSVLSPPSVPEKPRRGDGIHVNGPGGTINLEGVMIHGAPGNGVNIPADGNLTVKNSSIMGRDNGILQRDPLINPPVAAPPSPAAPK